MANILSFVFVLVVLSSSSLTTKAIDTIIGSINGHIVVEQNGTLAKGDPPVLRTDSEMNAKIEIKDLKSLTNVSYSWFVDDIEFKTTSTAGLVYTFNSTKDYKLMVIILANECKAQDVCSPKFGIIWRKIKVIDANDKVVGKLGEVRTEGPVRVRKRLVDRTDTNLYGALIIGGTILITLILISIFINTITLCNTSRVCDDNEDKQKLITHNESTNRHRFYTIDN